MTYGSGVFFYILTRPIFEACVLVFSVDMSADFFLQN
jgi:hypothetical protein